MDVDRKTGFMTGLCEEQCFLENHSCGGKSQLEADAQCCSGSCDVLSVDASGDRFGRCSKTRSGAAVNGVKMAVAAAVGKLTTSCKRVNRGCSGYSQDAGNAQCCSGYCHVMDVNRQTGFMTGLCEEQCFLENHGCGGKSQYEANAQCCSGFCDVTSTAADGHLYGICSRTSSGTEATDLKKADETEAVKSCKKVTRACSGWSQDAGNAQCCSGYCHLMDVDPNTGFMTGLCENQCYLVGQSCGGTSKYQADAECCTGKCDVRSVDAQGYQFGTCVKSGASKPVEEAQVESSCKRVNRKCSGYSQDAGNSQCCSGYCHVMDVDPKTGFMTGLCEEQCFLENQGCFGKSQYEADAQCCSAHCRVKSVDADGGLHGICSRASPAPTPPACRPLGDSCEGRTFGDADRQCCSGNCNNLTLIHGVYYGTCLEGSTPRTMKQL